MDYRQFIGEVQKRGGMASDRDALSATSATLRTLGERLTDKEAVKLAAQLPPDIGRFLTVVDPNKDFDLETFYKHIEQRSSTDQPVTREQARAVLSVLEGSIAPGKLQEVLARLPEDFLDMFPSHKSSPDILI